MFKELNENQENQSKLWDLLAINSWINRDIDYCQDVIVNRRALVLALDNKKKYKTEAFYKVMHMYLSWWHAMEINGMPINL